MNEAVDTEHFQAVPAIVQRPELEIPGAPRVRLQTPDLARHIAITPEGKRYVVATFDDTHVGNGFVTAIYPQQNGYLTLYRLVVCHVSSETPEEALQRHVAFVQAVQQGKLNELAQSLRGESQ